MKFEQFLLCAIAMVLPLSANAASEKNKDRWFEIEVILFSQLGDKSQLKENFPESGELPKYRRTNDLLAQYLNPNITSLKQLLPSCESPTYKPNLASQNAKLPTLFAEKSLLEISQIPALLSELSTLNEFDTAESSTLDESNTDNFYDRKTVQESAAESLNVPNTPEINSVFNNTFPAEVPTEISDEKRAAIQALVFAAEQKFSHIKFQYTPQPAPRIICRIDEKHFADMKVNDADFDYNGFTVDKMPLLIDAAEDIQSNRTHLLSKDSLKLDDIIKDLRYSKNFRPILHMGWRQVARPKKQSIPVKVYAGDNFSADYQKQLAQYLSNKNQVEQAQLLNDISVDAIGNDSAQHTAADDQLIGSQIVDNQAILLAQAKKARIADIVTQISAVTDDTERLLNSIETDDISLSVIDERALADKSKLAPIVPIQDWFIDGLFNVHLKHYLFITADFNILDKNLSQLATAQLAGNSITKNNFDNNSAIKNPSVPVQANAIRFKQDRRVISGEVHYFDHPYMGMIVQIRPYKKPIPEEEN